MKQLDKQALDKKYAALLVDYDQRTHDDMTCFLARSSRIWGLIGI